MARDAIKPISDCEFCCVPVARRGIAFQQNHPRCGACGILMGPGHIEENAEADFCSTCSRTRQRETALR